MKSNGYPIDCFPFSSKNAHCQILSYVQNCSWTGRLFCCTIYHLGNGARLSLLLLPPPPANIANLHICPSSYVHDRSVNDPDTNTCMYRRGFDDEGNDSPALKKSGQPHRQSESEPYQTAYAEEAIPVETPPTFMTPESADNDWFRFQEKGHLVQSRVNNIGGGVSRGNGGAKVELSTQLGLPATATHEEVWPILK